MILSTNLWLKQASTPVPRQLPTGERGTRYWQWEFPRPRGLPKSPMYLSFVFLTLCYLKINSRLIDRLMNYYTYKTHNLYQKFRLDVTIMIIQNLGKVLASVKKQIISNRFSKFHKYLLFLLQLNSTFVEDCYLKMQYIVNIDQGSGRYIYRTIQN